MKEETTHQGQMCLVCHEITTPDCKICGKFATVQEIGSLEMTQYHYEMVEGKPKIIISMVKVLDMVKYISSDGRISIAFLICS